MATDGTEIHVFSLTLALIPLSPPQISAGFGVFIDLTVEAVSRMVSVCLGILAGDFGSDEH